MTKEEIIEMGHKAKLPYDYVTGELMWLDSIEQFARLVAEKEREKCAELIPPQYFHFRDWIRARGKE